MEGLGYLPGMSALRTSYDNPLFAGTGDQEEYEGEDQHVEVMQPDDVNGTLSYLETCSSIEAELAALDVKLEMHRRQGSATKDVSCVQEVKLPRAPSAKAVAVVTLSPMSKGKLALAARKASNLVGADTSVGYLHHYRTQLAAEACKPALPARTISTYAGLWQASLATQRPASRAATQEASGVRGHDTPTTRHPKVPVACLPGLEVYCDAEQDKAEEYTSPRCCVVPAAVPSLGAPSSAIKPAAPPPAAAIPGMDGYADVSDSPVSAAPINPALDAQAEQQDLSTELDACSTSVATTPAKQQPAVGGPPAVADSMMDPEGPTSPHALTLPGMDVYADVEDRTGQDIIAAPAATPGQAAPGGAPAPTSTTETPSQQQQIEWGWSSFAELERAYQQLRSQAKPVAFKPSRKGLRALHTKGAAREHQRWMAVVAGAEAKAGRPAHSRQAVPSTPPAQEVAIDAAQTAAPPPAELALPQPAAATAPDQSHGCQPVAVASQAHRSDRMGDLRATLSQALRQISPCKLDNGSEEDSSDEASPPGSPRPCALQADRLPKAEESLVGDLLPAGAPVSQAALADMLARFQQTFAQLQPGDCPAKPSARATSTQAQKQQAKVHNPAAFVRYPDGPLMQRMSKSGTVIVPQFHPACAADRATLARKVVWELSTITEVSESAEAAAQHDSAESALVSPRALVPESMLAVLSSFNAIVGQIRLTSLDSDCERDSTDDELPASGSPGCCASDVSEVSKVDELLTSGELHADAVAVAPGSDASTHDASSGPSSALDIETSSSGVDAATDSTDLSLRPTSSEMGSEEAGDCPLAATSVPASTVSSVMSQDEPAVSSKKSKKLGSRVRRGLAKILCCLAAPSVKEAGHM